MDRYHDFLEQSLDKKTVFLELGVGMMTPMFIKEPFMNMTYQWKDATYITINPQHAIVPREIAAKSIGIKDDITTVFKHLLGKSLDGCEKFDVNNIFNPSRVY